MNNSPFYFLQNTKTNFKFKFKCESPKIKVIKKFKTYPIWQKTKQTLPTTNISEYEYTKKNYNKLLHMQENTFLILNI